MRKLKKNWEKIKKTKEKEKGKKKSKGRMKRKKDPKEREKEKRKRIRELPIPKSTTRRSSIGRYRVVQSKVVRKEGEKNKTKKEVNHKSSYLLHRKNTHSLSCLMFFRHRKFLFLSLSLLYFLFLFCLAFSLFSLPCGTWLNCSNFCSLNFLINIKTALATKFKAGVWIWCTSALNFAKRA